MRRLIPFYSLRTYRRHRDRSRALARAQAFYEGLVPPDSLVFDVGANIGMRTRVFLGLGHRVVAVEPQANCAEKLRAAFGDDPRFTLVPEALGKEIGEAKIQVASASTISSMSPEWIAAMSASNRFPDHEWGEFHVVPVTTLDLLIAKHGVPAFIKIDVEGYELPVLQGLGQPIDLISFEYLPEVADVTRACIDQVASLGPVVFNFSAGETMTLGLAEWVKHDDIDRLFAAMTAADPDNGDVYVRSAP